MDDKKVIKLRDKNNWHAGALCPYCGSISTIINDRPAQITKTRNEDNYYPGDKEIYYEMADAKCKDCSKEYVIDYGESSYLIYDTSESVNNPGDIVCYSKYESEMHQDFGIYSTQNPENESETIFFIKSERDRFPMFITKSAMEKMLHDCKEIENYIFCTWMTRYR